MRTYLAIIAVLVLSVATSPLANAAPDELMACTKLSIKPIAPEATNAKLEFRCKSSGGGFALPPNPLAVGNNEFGVSLIIHDLGGTVYVIPPNLIGKNGSGWSAIGNHSSPKGYRYRNSSKTSPCSLLSVTAKEIKGKCRANIGPGTLPFVGEAGLILRFSGAGDTSTSYCAQFGGTEVRNDSAALIRKSAPAPAVCPTIN